MLSPSVDLSISVGCLKLSALVLLYPHSTMFNYFMNLTFHVLLNSSDMPTVLGRERGEMTVLLPPRPALLLREILILGSIPLQLSPMFSCPPNSFRKINPLIQHIRHISTGLL